MLEAGDLELIAARDGLGLGAFLRLERDKGAVQELEMAMGPAKGADEKLFPRVLFDSVLDGHGWGDGGSLVGGARECGGKAMPLARRGNWKYPLRPR